MLRQQKFHCKDRKSFYFMVDFARKIVDLKVGTVTTIPEKFVVTVDYKPDLPVVRQRISDTLYHAFKAFNFASRCA